MTWNEAGGRVSRAFEDWRRADAENRAFLRLSAEWSEAAYEREWKQAEESLNRVFDPDRHYGDEHVDMFDAAVGGLWPSSYQWMVEASVLKNGVTAFEVYLEKGLQEVLETWRVTIGGQRGSLRLKTKGFTSPGWMTLVDAHSILGNTVKTAAVESARELRHLLTHQNGELRTEEALAKFRDEVAEKDQEEYDRTYVGGRVRLGAARVVDTLDAMGTVVRDADVAVLTHGPWGSKRDQIPLDELYEAKCLEFIPE
ncbi:hypothetical protein ABZ729_08055 [Streptomyces sp. NPDC006678]|uniref:hypothetical protein n=1 Tax=Streptomyces sp. NPDC006678 TaxID=3157185 RepID=UPI00340A5E6C